MLLGILYWVHCMLGASCAETIGAVEMTSRLRATALLLVWHFSL